MKKIFIINTIFFLSSCLGLYEKNIRFSNERDAKLQCSNKLCIDYTLYREHIEIWLPPFINMMFINVNKGNYQLKLSQSVNFNFSSYNINDSLFRFFIENNLQLRNIDIKELKLIGNNELISQVYLPPNITKTIFDNGYSNYQIDILNFVNKSKIKFSQYKKMFLIVTYKKKNSNLIDSIKLDFVDRSFKGWTWGI